MNRGRSRASLWPGHVDRQCRLMEGGSATDHVTLVGSLVAVKGVVRAGAVGEGVWMTDGGRLVKVVGSLHTTNTHLSLPRQHSSMH